VKVLQVCPVVSEGGVGAGPWAVAVQDQAALTARGHAVTLMYGVPGRSRDAAAGRVPLRTVVPPLLGLRGAWAPSLGRMAGGSISEYDIAHFHLSRDFVTAPFARRWMKADKPFVLQTHGMVMPDRRLRSRLFDRFLLDQIVHAAPMTFALTDAEREGLVAQGFHPERIHILRNGISPTDLRATWSDNGKPEILYLSRLTPRKRPEVMVELARRLHETGLQVATRIVGQDQGSLGAVRQAMARDPHVDVVYEGFVAPHEALSRMSGAQVFVLPSYEEPFPVALLEAMSLGLPCVITDRTGVSEELAGTPGVVVTDGSAEGMAAAVSLFLSSEERWHRAQVANLQLVAERYSAATVAAQLERHYDSVMAGRALG
jgi:glycosyltransferase involved in cell wall biosynthesis